jgi:hypothetical protein
MARESRQDGDTRKIRLSDSGDMGMMAAVGLAAVHATANPVRLGNEDQKSTID